MSENIFERKDCFAYVNSTKDGCSALKIKNCLNCSFYKQDVQKKDVQKKDCFAYVSKKNLQGCKILKERTCKNCSFYKTTEQKDIDLKNAFNRIQTLPDYVRSNIKDLYEECNLKEEDIGGVMV